MISVLSLLIRKIKMVSGLQLYASSHICKLLGGRDLTVFLAMYTGPGSCLDAF